MYVGARIQTHETNKIAPARMRARADGNFQTLVNSPAYDLTLGKMLDFLFSFFFFLRMSLDARSMINCNGLVVFNNTERGFEIAASTSDILVV